MPDGNVDWVTRSANEMRLSVETDRNSLLVISQNYYPAWQASVDEIAVTPIRVNHALIAIPLEAGTHEVVLTYRSETVWFSLWVSAFSTLLLLLGVALGPFGGTEGRRKSAGVPQTVP